MAQGPKISIVLTSHEPMKTKNVIDLIECFLAQTYQYKELVVVVEGSDELYRIVQSYSQRSVRDLIACYMVSRGTGASASRNLGIKHATGDIIAFVDDDVMIPKDWAERVLDTFLNNSCIGVIGPVLPQWQDNQMSWLPDELLWLVSCTGWLDYEAITPVKGHTWTSNAAFRREAFTEETMFSEDLGPTGGDPGWRRRSVSEDVELSIRIQKKSRKAVLYNPEARVWKNVQSSLLAWSHVKDCAYGIGVSRVSKRQLLSTEERNPFSTEEALLKRILLRLVPLSIADFFVGRSSSSRRLSLVLFTLFFLAVGYMHGTIFGTEARKA